MRGGGSKVMLYTPVKRSDKILVTSRHLCANYGRTMV